MVRGRLVPCGCFTGQMGGLTRVATMVGLGQNPGALKVDVGDAIEGVEDYQRIQHRYILEAFAKMGYDAANLGHREAALSAAQLRELKARAPVPLISANLLDKKTGVPLFETHRIVRRGHWRIAMVGVMDSRIPAEALGEGLAVERIETALARLLPVVKKEADFVVLLALTDEAALASLACDFYELDVILGGKVAQPSQQLVCENRSLILATTNQSRALGLLELTLATPTKLTARSGDVILMHDKIAEDESIRALARVYRDEIRGAKLAIDDPATLQAGMVPGVKSAATFAGTPSCIECHAGAAKVWAGSGYAHAFAALVERKADADPNCIGCHTVGFGTPSGYRREFGATKLTDVGLRELPRAGCAACGAAPRGRGGGREVPHDRGGRLRDMSSRRVQPAVQLGQILARDPARQRGGTGELLTAKERRSEGAKRGRDAVGPIRIFASHRREPPVAGSRFGPEKVLGGGLEPPRLAAYAPQTYVSANSTIRAFSGAGFLAGELAGASGILGVGGLQKRLEGARFGWLEQAERPA